MRGEFQLNLLLSGSRGTINSPILTFHQAIRNISGVNKHNYTFQKTDDSAISLSMLHVEGGDSPLAGWANNSLLPHSDIPRPTPYEFRGHLSNNKTWKSLKL
jgi:hypothetical protein